MLTFYKKADLPPKAQLKLIRDDIIKHPAHYELENQRTLKRIFGDNERLRITELCTMLLGYPAFVPTETLPMMQFINYVLEES